VTEDEARAAVVAAGRRLLADGLVARTWGNLSVRLDDAMLVTPSGIPYPELTERSVVRVDLGTGTWSGPLRPSGEREVHRETYRRRPDVHAVVHTHQVAASVCAAARTAVTTSFGDVPCAAYGLPGTGKLTRATVDALGEGPAALMANHGVLAVGAGLGEAFRRVHALERECAAHAARRAADQVGTVGPVPAPFDAPWDPAALAGTRLADGSPAWWSTAPYTAFVADRRLPMPAVLDDVAQLTGRQVPCLADVPRRRPHGDAVLVAGRGALVVGDDHEATAMVVEKAARAWVGARLLTGRVRPLPAWEALLMRTVYVRSYSRRAAVIADRG
jgi:L-ribulose-5-phosphate 4-epimerase